MSAFDEQPDVDRYHERQIVTGSSSSGSSSRNNNSSTSTPHCTSSSSNTNSASNWNISMNARKLRTSSKGSISSWISNQRCKTSDVIDRELTSTAYAACPICNTSLRVQMMNVHLDSCLGSGKETRKRKSASDTDVFFFSTEATPPSPMYMPMQHSDLPGLWLIHDFISEAEELSIISQLENDKTAWHLSTFNGHCLGKSFGLKTQFGPSHVEERIVRLNNVSKGEQDVPEYLLPCVAKLTEFLRCSSQTFKMPSVLKTFKPNECNANCYVKSENHSLTAHYDDRFLSGPILMNLSLLGRSIMTYSKGNSSAIHDIVKVNLPRRCLQLVTGDARYKYMHRIDAVDVLDERRMSVTWRQAGDSNGGLIRGLNGIVNGPIQNFLDQKDSTQMYDLTS